VKNIETKKDLLREWRLDKFTSPPADSEKEEETKNHEQDALQW
jgi:hypothetical protein